MDRKDVQEWLDRYVTAWRANQPEPIAALFTEDATYAFRPYGGDASAVQGNEAIVKAWLEHPDEPDSWEAHYEPFAVDGDRAVATGSSHYHATEQESEKTYRNVFLLRFSPDGRCAEFTEFFMREKA